MAAKGPRENITLECTECKRRNYVTSKNNEVYIFEYFIESNDKQCTNAKDIVLQSIKSK